MEIPNSVISDCMLYEFKLGRNANVREGRIFHAFRRDVVNDQITKWWFNKFKDAGESLQVASRIGRLHTIDNEVLMATIKY